MAIVYGEDRANHLALITIDRPQARNAVNGEVATGIEAALDQFEADPGLWIAILTGTPPVFCSGADLKEVAAGNARAMRTKRGGFAGLVRRERTKPLIAAVEGPCLAGGTEIILSCDIVVAASDSTFGIPEVRRSIIAGGGALFRLGRRIPHAIAMEWALTGDAYSAQRAADLGLINAVCEPGQALTAAREFAGRIALGAPLAVRLSRQLIMETTYLDEKEAWRRSTEAVNAVATSNDFREGLQAFAEKRPPVWTAT
jgi:enoyl-CoA hydratase